MKKISLIIAIILPVFIWSCGGGSSEEKKSGEKEIEKIKENKTYVQGEKEAEEVLKAYTERNLELLKTYAPSMFKSLMDDDFFESTTIKYYLKVIDNWDGEIREVRYKMQEVTFEKTYYATAHYADDPNKDDKLYTVILKSKDKKKWHISSNGLSSIKSEDFAKMSLTLPDEDTKAE